MLAGRPDRVSGGTASRRNYGGCGQGGSGDASMMAPAPWSCEPSREHLFPGEAGPVVAYRIWQIRNPAYGLRALHPLCPAEWSARAEVAHCLARSIAARANRPGSQVDHEGPAPERACTCGLSALYEPLHDHPGISGVVTISGRTILHDVWLRTETARIECLALGPRVSADDHAVITGLASEWAVPVVANHELEAFGLGLGRAVPRALRPSEEVR